MPRSRNWLHHHPLLRKGGVHKRSRSGERQVLRDALQSELDEHVEQPEDRAETVTPASADVGDDLCEQ